MASIHNMSCIGCSPPVTVPLAPGIGTVQSTQIHQETSQGVDFPLRATRLETAQRKRPDMSQDDRCTYAV